MNSTEKKPHQLTPMLRQYHEIKKQYPGTLLFFRLGDFYELFFDDALLGSREMEITLTARQKEHGSPIPMCGVPYHSASNYIARLVKKGYRVAICEQSEPAGEGKKLVRREVVRVITPGTALESQLLEPRQNNFLASVCGAGERMGLAFLDISTGDFLTTEFSGANALEIMLEQIEIFAPSEVIFPNSLSSLIKDRLGNQPTASASYNQSRPDDISSKASTSESTLPKEEALNESRKANNVKSADTHSTLNLKLKPSTVTRQITLTPLDDWQFGYEHAEGLLKSTLSVNSLDGFGLTDKVFAVSASGASIHYLNETQKSALLNVTGISYFALSDHLILDATTISNLNLIDSQAKDKRQTLLAVIDETMTGMGSRLLRQWLIRPLIDRGKINTRLKAVEEIKGSSINRDRLRKFLEPLSDIERLTGKITLGRANARDLVALRISIEIIPEVRQSLTSWQSDLVQVLYESLDELTDVRSLIAEAIADDPPPSLNDVGIIREGYHAELDELRHLANSGKSYIAAIESRERGRTGISSLKVRFNNIFGYFIEVSHSNRDKVPADYERKQTLANSERFTTPELKEYEVRVLGAEERIAQLELELFTAVRQRVAQETRRLQAVAKAISTLDVLQALAETAAVRNYTRPELHDGDEIEIRHGRHPIIEAAGDRFTPNDLLLNNTTDRLLIITGPNMGGKSVFLKQAALITILAQIGSFVPASSARLSIVDRIFTRVGAADDLAQGRSTFMVEMTETASILNTATPRSLVLLDEVGRGTATFDGLSIAWAIGEYLHDHPHHSAKTLFATHYHEMTELARLRPGVRNYQVAVSESGGDIVFLRKVIPGATSKSYGIEVARLAGLPGSVIERAREILTNLETNELDPAGKPKFARHLKKPSARTSQMSLLDHLHTESDQAEA
jgi:DNA mismatch repair protein MutS